MSDTLRSALEKAIDGLFINGQGDEAERLVLTSREGRDLGGWCKAAIRDRLLAALAESAPTPEAPKELADAWRAIRLLVEGDEAEVNAVIRVACKFVDDPDAAVLLRHVAAQADRLKGARVQFANAAVASTPAPQTCATCHGSGRYEFFASSSDDAPGAGRIVWTPCPDCAPRATDGGPR